MSAVSQSVTEAAPTISCPRCGYTGEGFHYVELAPCISDVIRMREGFLVRLDRGELRFDEIDEDGDRLNCPVCSHQFPVPAEVKARLVFAARTELLRQLNQMAA